MTTTKWLLDGDVKQSGLCDIDKHVSIKDIIDTHGSGVKNNGKVKFVQVGGPLGRCINPTHIRNPLVQYMDGIKQNIIMVMDEHTCPVDFCFFCLQHVRRELLVINKSIENLEIMVSRIIEGKGQLRDIMDIIKESNVEAETMVEIALKQLICFMIDNFKQEFLQHIEERHCVSGACRKLIDANCINACPGKVNVPGYVALMKDHREQEAYLLMKQRNPFPFICGKICARPCEANCRRGQIEKTVGVRALKRYVANYVLDYNGLIESKMPFNGKRVAIVGAGPAGLTAAYYLARTGYKVVVYEGSKVVGGMLAMGIPSFRLPQTTIDQEVCALKALGVVIKTHTVIGKDIALRKLRDDYNAVLLATGCHIGNRFGPEIDSIEPAIHLLREVKTEGRNKIGKRVLVIGGGDVAMDAARTAVRLGADKVTIVTLESFEAMPASEEEKHEVQEEGIEFINGYGSKTIDIDKHDLKGITLKRCLSVIDDSGRFSPRYSEEDTIYLEVDHIILAIGQKPDLSYLDRDIAVTKQGFMHVDTRTYRTSADRVYATGDMSRPGVAIKAIAEGKKAAESIDKDLGGKGLYLGEEIDIPEQQLHYSMWDNTIKLEKVEEPKIRVCGFSEVTHTLTSVEAHSEADRCMRCDRNSKRSC